MKVCLRLPACGSSHSCKGEHPNELKERLSWKLTAVKDNACTVRHIAKQASWARNSKLIRASSCAISALRLDYMLGN